MQKKNNRIPFSPVFQKAVESMSVFAIGAFAYLSWSFFGAATAISPCFLPEASVFCSSTLAKSGLAAMGRLRGACCMRISSRRWSLCSAWCSICFWDGTYGIIPTARSTFGDRSARCSFFCGSAFRIWPSGCADRCGGILIRCGKRFFEKIVCFFSKTSLQIAKDML